MKPDETERATALEVRLFRMVGFNMQRFTSEEGQSQQFRDALTALP